MILICVWPIVLNQGQNFKSHLSKNKSESYLKSGKYIKNGDSTDCKEYYLALKLNVQINLRQHVQNFVKIWFKITKYQK